MVLLNSFFMSKFEITNQQYCNYLNSAISQALIEVCDDVVYAAPGGTNIYCFTSEYSPGYSRIIWNGSTFDIVSGKEDHPMLVVSWYGAVAYCNWRSGQEDYENCRQSECPVDWPWQ